MHAGQLGSRYSTPCSLLSPLQSGPLRLKCAAAHKPFRKQNCSGSPAGRRFGVASASKRDELPTVTQPFSVHGVDRELWMVLDLASDTELEGVHDMLFGEPINAYLACCMSVTQSDNSGYRVR